MKRLSWLSGCIAGVMVLSCQFVFPGYAADLNPLPPSTPVRLIFIHHSTGENWLSDDNGELGLRLRDNNYFVSDTNYGWGPDAIGDRTDIGNWWEWFRSPRSQAYLSALYTETEPHSSYSRLGEDTVLPSGENSIVLFKSCFPNSDLQGNVNDPVPAIDKNPLKGEGSGSDYHTVANAKGIYTDLLEYFRSRQDKLFVVITAPPRSDPAYSSNARAFNLWLVNEWLGSYPYRNVAVFDFYNVLTTNGGSPDISDMGRETGNHHRWRNGTIQHKNDAGSNILAYPSEDDHPGRAGNLKATGEFYSLLNVFYHCWKGTGGCPGNTPVSPKPEIRINGMQGSIFLKQGDVLTASVSLETGSLAGMPADWWVAFSASDGWHPYLYPAGWEFGSGASLLPAYQGALFNLPSSELLRTTSLQTGSYVFYFGFDTVMNGIVDFDYLYYDGVVVNITD